MLQTYSLAYLGGPHTLHIALHLLDEGDELHEPAPEQGHLLPHPPNMLAIDVVQGLEGVAGVVAAPEGALVADALAAGPAVDGELLLVHLALVLASLGPAQPAAHLLQGVQLLGHLLHPPQHTHT